MSITTDSGAPAATESPAATLVAETTAQNVVEQLAQNVASGQETVQEPAKIVEETPKTVEEARVAAKFAALSRQEKALKAQEKALAQRAKELEERLAAIENATKDESKYISREEFRKNPYKYMTEDKISLESVAELALNDGKKSPEQIAAEIEAKMEAKVKAMEDKLAQKEQAEQQAQIEAALNAYKQQLTDFANNTPDYELIRANDAMELVYEVIEQHCEATIDEETGKGIILSNKEACDMVEKYLLDQEKARIEKYRNLNKTKGMFEPPATKVEPSVKAPESTTLTNTLAAEVPTKGSRTLTDEESKREAAKLLKWNS
jgi:hypothetical protein